MLPSLLGLDRTCNIPCHAELRLCLQTSVCMYVLAGHVYGSTPQPVQLYACVLAVHVYGSTPQPVQLCVCMCILAGHVYGSTP